MAHLDIDDDAPLPVELRDAKASTPPIDPASAEHTADRLLQTLRTGLTAAVFDWVDDQASISNPGDALACKKAAADLLVKARLARFSDDTRTSIEITNAGRYWAAHGGYLAFLKEEPPAGGGAGARARNPETEALRAEYMKLRLDTFWWNFGLSIAGFAISIISILIALFTGAKLPR